MWKANIYFYLFTCLIIYLKLINLQKYSIHIYIKLARQIGQLKSSNLLIKTKEKEKK